MLKILQPNLYLQIRLYTLKNFMDQAVFQKVLNLVIYL